MGVRARNLVRSSWVVAVALALAACTWAVAARFGALHLRLSLTQLIATYFAYIVWSFVQQFLLLSFFLARLLRLMSNRYSAAAVAAGLFALAHLPNPVLTPLTLVWGMIACLLFLRYRNVWTLGMAHAILGITVAVCLPVATHSMRVGLGYLHYRRPAVCCEARGNARSEWRILSSE
jgi:membrane protease YdiL (CAAX protease family)